MKTQRRQTSANYRTRDLSKGAAHMLVEMKQRLAILKLKSEANRIFHSIQQELDTGSAGSISYTYADFATMPNIDFLPLSTDSTYAPEKLCCHYGAMINAITTAHAKLVKADQIGRDIGLGGIAYAFVPHRLHPIFSFVTLCIALNNFFEELQAYNEIPLTHKHHV
jgi:hypothetical protein